MGYKELELKVPVGIHDDELEILLRKQTGLRQFTYSILRKSLDARKKQRIVWQYRVGIESSALPKGEKPEVPTLHTEYKKRNKHILITGSGPAGIFPALYLAQCGFKVSLIERGSKVEQRKQALDKFEQGGAFDPANNYAFGEGGAGTFSDGKLTSRTKSIKPERNYIYEQFIKHGGPEEIHYMTHPHLGTDKLFRITQNMRAELEKLGVQLLYETQLESLIIKEGRVKAAVTSKGNIEADEFLLATGHSAFETYRMLIRAGVPFRSKNFALGFRVEHQQQLINKAQWGVASLPGVKAAEYRLTTETSNKTPVYSFCMCPGGKVVPATAYPHTNIVNGMSYYNRDSAWANAAVVAGINLSNHFKRPVSALEALDWLEGLEQKYHSFADGYNAPACTIDSFLENNAGKRLPESSYPFSLVQADFRALLPHNIVPSLQQGLKDFCKKIPNYNQGIIIGLESKTSSPIQVERLPGEFHTGFPNLFVVGEGSGWAGGIISSAADGLKASQQILANAR